MTAEDLRRTVEQRFEAAGLVPYLDRGLEQFLEVGNELFAEIVVNDASKLSDAKRIFREIVGESARLGTVVDGVVRAAWKIGGEAEPVGPARTLSGGIAAAEEYVVPIRCGSVERQVRVQVTISALNLLREKVGIQPRPNGRSLSGDVDSATVAKAVREFVALSLSFGGTSYWDPEQHPILNMNEAAMSYLLGHPVAV